MERNVRHVFACLTALLPLSLASCAQQQSVQARDEGSKQDGVVQIQGVPAAVEKTVKEQSAGGMLVGLTTEREKNVTLYEAEMKINGHSKNLLIDSSGNIREVEEETTLSALPPGVQPEVQKSVGKSKILAMESISKAGKLAGFELRVQDAKGKESTLNLRADGKPQGKDEDGEDDDDEEDDVR
jgi:hypothetical protein